MVKAEGERWREDSITEGGDSIMNPPRLLLTVRSGSMVNHDGGVPQPFSASSVNGRRINENCNQ